MQAIDMKNVLPRQIPRLANLLSSMLCYNTFGRYTISEVLSDPFLQDEDERQ